MRPKKIDSRQAQQEAARIHWLAFDGIAPIDMEQEDFGFNNDFQSAMEMGDILVLSNFTILPNEGGWSAQYKDDADDILTYLRGLAWARNQKEAEDEDTTTDNEETPNDGFATIADWQAAFK